MSIVAGEALVHGIVHHHRLLLRWKSSPIPAQGWALTTLGSRRIN